MAMLTTRQAAERLGVDPAHVRLLARSGTIKATKMGRDWLVDADSVEAYRGLEGTERRTRGRKGTKARGAGHDDERA